MTKTTQNTADTLRVQSGPQDMFGSGAAKEISFNDYIPIIGGGITELEAQGAFALDGRATVDGDTIRWDDQGEFDALRPGEVVTTAVVWDVLDENGKFVRDGGAEIEVRGTAQGPVFTNLTTGETSTDGLTFIAFDAQDMLQDVHDFERVELVDVDFDLTEIFDVDLDAVVGDLADMGELAGLAAKVGALEVGAKAARGTANAAKAADKFINDLQIEQNVAKAAVGTAKGVLDGAEAAVEAFEDALNGAKNFLADTLDAISDAGRFLGSLAGDAAFFLEIGALEARILAPDFIGGDEDVLQAQIDRLFRERDKLKNAEADKRQAENDVERLADGLRDVKVNFDDAVDALNQAERDAERAINKVADAVEDFRQEFQGKTVAQLERLADAAERELKESKAELNDALETLQDRGLLNDVRSGVDDVAKTILDLGAGALKELDEATFDIIDEVDVTANLEVGVDAFAQAGLLVDFKLDGGSVTSDLDYELTSTATLDTVADTFTVNAQAASATTGEAVAFETLSPNMSFFAGIAYNAGATFDFLVDMFANVGGVDLVDLGPLTFEHDVQFDGVLSLIDFDSTEFDGFELPIPGFLGDIFSAEVNFPTVETKGKAAEFSTDPYTDPTSFVDLDQIADLILDLADLRLDFSPEFKALLAKRGAETDIKDDEFAAAVKQALGAVLDSVIGDGDTDGDGFVPVLQVTTGELGANSLIHLDTIKNDLSQIDLENGGKFGFFVSEGASNNLVQMELDVDQLIATVVNVALGNSPQSTINPLDLAIGIGEIMDIGGVPKKVQDAVKQFIAVDLSVEVADLDVRTGANFSQEFALSVDDVDFSLVFEDGTTRTVSANEGGEIVIENASGLVDVNENGQIDYTLELTPDATLFNDTEIGLNVGYTLDFIKAQLELAASLPLDGLIPGVDLGTLEGFSEAFSFGPLLRLEGDLDVVSADVFESLFDFDAGSAGITGSFDVALGDDTPVVEVTGGLIKGTSEGESLIGSDEKDTIRARGGDDIIEARAGNDKVIGGGGSDLVFGQEGRDKIKGGKGVDIISAGEGRDVLIGGKGDDILQGDEGNDTFKFKKGDGADNILDFEVGIDTIQIGRGANGIEDLSFDQQGSTAVVSFQDVEITMDSVSVEALLAADSFSF